MHRIRNCVRIAITEVPIPVSDNAGSRKTLIKEVTLGAIAVVFTCKHRPGQISYQHVDGSIIITVYGVGNCKGYLIDARRRICVSWML